MIIKLAINIFVHYWQAFARLSAVYGGTYMLNKPECKVTYVKPLLSKIFFLCFCMVCKPLDSTYLLLMQTQQECLKAHPLRKKVWPQGTSTLGIDHNQ